MVVGKLLTGLAEMPKQPDTDRATGRINAGIFNRVAVPAVFPRSQKRFFCGIRFHTGKYGVRSSIMSPASLRIGIKPCVPDPTMRVAPVQACLIHERRFKCYEVPLSFWKDNFDGEGFVRAILSRGLDAGSGQSAERRQDPYEC